MNATNFATNKDFRRTVDIRQRMRHGKIEKKIYLPPEDFAYGKNSRPPKVVPRYINPKVEELRRKEMEKRAGSLDYDPMTSPYDEMQQTKKDDKPLYKLKMFQDVGSKVAEDIKQFKTYHPYKKKKKNEDGVDYLINKVQGEIQQNQNQNLNQYQPNNYAPQYQPQSNYQQQYHQPPQGAYNQQQYEPPQGNYQQQPIPQ